MQNQSGLDFILNGILGLGKKEEETLIIYPCVWMMTKHVNEMKWELFFDNCHRW